MYVALCGSYSQLSHAIDATSRTPRRYHRNTHVMSRWFTKNPDSSIMGMMDPGADSTANCIVGATELNRNDQLFVHTTVARQAK